MSKTNLVVYWIDDVLEHREDVKNLMFKNKKLKVLFYHPNEFIEKINVRLDDYQPDMFLVDYFLNRISDENKKKYDFKGLTLAGTIRENYPMHPIYAMTNETLFKMDGPFTSEAYASKNTFDKIFNYNEIQKYGDNILYNDAIYYKLLRQTPQKNVKSLFNLLNTPDNIRETLRTVLPTDLRCGLNNNKQGNCMAFARWVRYELLIKPGFLYDIDFTANYLGTTIESFEKISTKLSKAKYRGIFSKTTEPLWWVSELDRIIFSYKKAKEIKEVDVWRVAPLIFDIPSKNLSKCGICGEPYPEAIGVNINNNDDWRPVHYKCSEPDPNVKQKLYYDEIRAFKSKGK